jgi:endonuclease G, mitochondrial
MDDQAIIMTTLIDTDSINRFNARTSNTLKVMDVLASNNPDEILKLDTKERIKERRKQILKQNLPDVTIERVIAGSDLMPIYYLEKGKKVAESICRIELMDEMNNTQGYGTGFMVSPSLLMTNNHVIGNPDDCKNSLAQFHFEKDLTFIDKPVVSFRFNPRKFFYTNKALDFTLVCVNPTSLDNQPLSNFGYLALIKKSGKAVIGEYVSIIQHPKGSQKQVAMRENRVIDIFDDFVHSKADTEPGSSGSPVFNDQWTIVSLHHSGVPRKDSQGNYLAVDGKVWTPDLPDSKIDWIGNESIRVSSIVSHLENIVSQIPAQERTVLEEFLNTVIRD